MNTIMKFVRLLIILLLFAPLFVSAQESALPNAGITPESPFYFIDRWGEAVREFLTLNPESRARLHVAFAAERVSEIKIILKTKGVDAKGLEVAQSRLQEHLADASKIVINLKAEGKNVVELEEELENRFDHSKAALEQAFEEEERVLETQEDELEQKIKEARRVGDTAQVEALIQQLGQVKAQLELLEIKEEDAEEALEQEEERLEEEMELIEEQKERARGAEEEQEERNSKKAERELEQLEKELDRVEDDDD